ncbi:MAG: extracellular solute-binding protein [Lachnospiraceae bacterium]|nr:extracellular solute-binding protein [Lachnospiraceae bacterium]
MNKRLLAVLLATVMTAAALAGCGNSSRSEAGSEDETGSAETGSGESGQVTLRVLNYTDLTAPGALDELSFVWDTFERDHPNIILDREDEYSESYHSRVESYVAAGTIPDVIYCWPSGRSSALHTKRLLKDLAPLIERDGLDRVFNAAALDPSSQAGGYLAVLPRGIDVSHTFWVNNEVLNAVGLTPAKTYAELKGQVNTLAAAGYETVLMPGQAPWVMQSCLFSLLAGRFMGASWEQRILNGETDFTDPQFVAALEFVEDMYTSGVLAQSSLDLGYGEAPGLFSVNQAAYYIDGGWRVGNFITDLTTGEALIDPARQNNFDAMVFPDIDSPWSVAFNRSNSGSYSGGWGISASLADGSPELEAAWTLVKWLNSKEVMEYLLDAGAVANIALARSDVDFSSLSLEPLQVKTANLSRHFEKTTASIDGSFANSVYEPLNDYLRDLALGTMSPEQVAQALQGVFDEWKATR